MILLLLACATDPVLSLDGDADRGASLYAAECIACHGNDGEGTSRGPVLLAPEDDQAAGEALDVIRFGRGDMPAFPLDDQQLADWLAWIRR